MPPKKSRVYLCIKATIRFFYKKMEVLGQEYLPQKPCLVVSNHAQMNGPIACELYFPGKRYTWCIGQMMHREEVPKYAFQDFWARKPWYSRWFFWLLSYAIAPLSECIFTNAETIGVYKDGRALSTFKNTVKRLCEGANVVIFPEHDAPHNHVVCDFQDKFIDVARLYYKRSGQALTFVPMYICPDLGKMVLGAGITFRPEAPVEEERQRICDYLMEAITSLALELPPHTVVPYNNLPRRKYPRSK